MILPAAPVFMSAVSAIALAAVVLWGSFRAGCQERREIRFAEQDADKRRISLDEIKRRYGL